MDIEKDNHKAGCICRLSDLEINKTKDNKLSLVYYHANIRCYIKYNIKRFFK